MQVSAEPDWRVSASGSRKVSWTTAEETFIFANKFHDRELEVLQGTNDSQDDQTMVMPQLDQVVLELTRVFVPWAGS